MFTGMSQALGIIKKITTSASGKMIVLKSPTAISDQVKIGDSVMVNGVCQTVCTKDQHLLSFDCVHNTLKKSTLGNLKVLEQVNLELALTLSDRLGGHLVTGHVSDVGRIRQLRPLGGNFIIVIEIPTELRRYIVPEGSIAIDGISLTVAEYINGKVTVSIVPHTYNSTNLKFKTIGSLVNIEVDMIAKYLDKLIRVKATNHYER